MQIDDEKALEQLKQIFLNESDERQDKFEDEINDLKFKLSDKEAKIETYYPIITDILERKVTESEDEVAKVFSPILGKALKKEISESKEDIIDALYPIMGQTIKKYVAEAIKDVYNSINLKIDNALRRGIFSKQIKSKISGVSTTDLILQESFPFNVDEIFFIHEKSGILITHVSSKPELSKDADLVSGMLTAIKDFVSDSFKNDDGDQNLYEIQYGGSRIILERGRYSYLAIVAKGNEPADFDEKLMELNSEIHKRFYKQLRDFNGEFNELIGSDEPIKEFLEYFKTSNNTEITEKPKPILGYLFGAILLIFLIIYGAITIPGYFGNKKIENEITDRLKGIQGLELNNIKWKNDNGNVKLSGFVKSFSVLNKVDSVLGEYSEINNLENNLGIIFYSLKPDSISKLINNRISKTKFSESSNLTFQIKNDKVIVDGEVHTMQDKREIGFLISQIPGVRFIENNLEYSLETDLTNEQAIAELNRMKLYFDFGETSVTKNHIEELDKVIPFIKENNFELILSTFADKIGNRETNLLYSTKRAENILGYLVSQGIEREKVKIENRSSASSEDSLDGRRVEIKINQ